MIINSFLGIRNTNPKRSIPDNALADAIDVDIDDVGVLTQRFGSTQALSISNVTSAYETLNRESYIVANSFLYKVLPDLSLIQIAPCTASQFTDFGKVLFTNDGLKVIDNNAINIKIPSPVLPPDVTIVSGNLPAGTYNVCCCFVSTDGIEGGSSPSQTIELLDSSHGITIDIITPPVGFTVSYYQTEAGGSVYYDSNGLNLEPFLILADSFPDNADCIAFHESRLWISAALEYGGSIIWFSDVNLYHVFNYAANYLMIPGAILAMESTANGLLVCTDSAIYLCDDISMQVIAEYGVVEGRPVQKAQDGQVFIFTKQGLCKAFPFENLTENKYSFPVGVTCSTSLIDRKGTQSFVALTDGSGEAYNKSP